jgi:hypothetical protein
MITSLDRVLKVRVSKSVLPHVEQLYSMTSITKKHFRLLSERPIDIPEIIQLIAENKIDYIEDFASIKELELGCGNEPRRA